MPNNNHYIFFPWIFSTMDRYFINSLIYSLFLFSLLLLSCYLSEFGSFYQSLFLFISLLVLVFFSCVYLFKITKVNEKERHFFCFVYCLLFFFCLFICSNASWKWEWQWWCEEGEVGEWRNYCFWRVLWI